LPFTISRIPNLLLQLRTFAEKHPGVGSHPFPKFPKRS